MSNGERPPTVELPVGSAKEFIELVWADLELAFSRQFGPRWTPAINAMYQDAKAACYAQARIVDDGMAQPEPPIQHPRVLTNYPDGR